MNAPRVKLDHSILGRKLAHFRLADRTIARQIPATHDGGTGLSETA
jgi:hypothetical protein